MATLVTGFSEQPHPHAALSLRSRDAPLHDGWRDRIGGPVEHQQLATARAELGPVYRINVDPQPTFSAGASVTFFRAFAATSCYGSRLKGSRH